jgi:hypothetical protein
MENLKPLSERYLFRVSVGVSVVLIQLFFFYLAVKGNVLFVKIIYIIFLLGDNDFKLLN